MSFDMICTLVGHLLLKELPIYLCKTRCILLQKLVGDLFSPAGVETLIAGPLLQGETRWVHLVLGRHILEANNLSCWIAFVCEADL